jgi:hypothetical protein
VFADNRSVNNFGGVHVTNVYNRTVINNYNTSSRVAFNGGTGGLTTRPTAQEQGFAHEQHVAPNTLQTQHEQTAASNPALRASVNHGAPAIAATSRPNEFTGRGVVAARPAITPAATGAPLHPGGAPAPAINRPGAAPTLHAPATAATPAVHGPTTSTAHPGTVTPGTQFQHPDTTGTPHPVTSGAPTHAVTPVAAPGGDASPGGNASPGPPGAARSAAPSRCAERGTEKALTQRRRPRPAVSS